MLRLSLDGATPFLSVALADDHQILASTGAELARGSENFLPAAVTFCLERSGRRLDEVEEFICTLGPGSFTGVRVTLATALGLAAGRGRPLVGLDTLRAMALACSQGVGHVAPVLVAKRDEIYSAMYRKNPRGLTEMLEPRAESPAAFAARVQDIRPAHAVIGTAAELFTPRELPGADFHAMPFLAPTLLGRAARALLTPVDPLAPAPVYLRDAATTPAPAR